MKETKIFFGLSGKDPEFDITEAAAFLQIKEADRQKTVHARFIRATAECTAIVEMLIRQFAPKRIYQWGSLLDENNFSEISDIDLALEGTFDAETFFAMYAEAEKLTDFALDLVDISKIHPLHAASIKNKGRLIYEQTGMC